jgi:Fructose/tagatose bisphosphate aldolase
MIDGSALPYEENIALTKKVVEYAHQHDVTVEAELGVLAGVEDEVASEVSHYTKPEEVIDFATRTGCDSLAISIGTSHGAYKFKPEQCTRDPKTGKLVPPPLAFDVLHAIEKSSRASRSFSTVLLPCRRTKSIPSTPTVASSRMPSVFRKNSSAKLLALLSAKSTSTLTAVSP